ncbi:MAG: protein kinase, partial [Abitibacteriaceae bacterium]|nr:protein kinase [Abditibacteriaceae bacterium]
MLCPHCSTSNISKALACRSCGASLHDAPKTVGPLHLLVGTKLQGGNFSIGKLVQQDDMGFTYMGSDSRVHRLVGVKELFPVGSSRREKAVIAAASALSAYNAAKRQFLQDAQTFLELRHPHLHRALAAFEEHNSVYFIVESTPGKSLAVLLQERGSPLNETEALTYIEKVGAALATAHGAGLLHSDLRPEHVLISADKQPILTNFQLGSKALHGLLNGHSTSSSTKLISRYAAPEHYTPGAQISASTDVYGLAAMLYHMLTGNPPIAATARAKGVALKAIKALNPQISATVAQSVMAALSLDALQRPQSITVFLQQLKAAPANHQKPTAGFTLAPVAPLPSHAPAVAPAPTLLPHDLLLRTTPAPSVTVTIIPPKQDAPLRATVSAFHPTSATVSKLTGHAGRVSSVAFSPVGNLLASAGEDGAVLIRDARGGALQRSLTEALPQTLVGVVSEARPRSLNDTLSLAQTVRHSVQSSLQGQVKRVSAVSFSPDGRTLACGNEDSVI